MIGERASLGLPVSLISIHSEAFEAVSAMRAAIEAGKLTADYAQKRIRFATAIRNALGFYQTTMARLSHEQRLEITGLPLVAEKERELRLSYSAHVAHWTSRAIDADPAGYARSSLALMKSVIAHRQMLEQEFDVPAFRLLDATSGTMSQLPAAA